MLLSELIIHHSFHQTGLAHTRITNDNQFEHVVVFLLQCFVSDVFVGLRLQTGQTTLLHLILMMKPKEEFDLYNPQLLRIKRRLVRAGTIKIPDESSNRRYVETKHRDLIEELSLVRGNKQQTSLTATMLQKTKTLVNPSARIVSP